MALTKCPECNINISDSAKMCPNCGFTKETPIKNSFIRTTLKTCLILIGIITLFFGYFIAKEFISPTDISENKLWVVDKGKESLKTNLKDPDSVIFGETWTGRMKDDHENTDKGLVVACGYFNAKNGFGGMSGNKRFIGVPNSLALTDETIGEAMMDEAWSKVCQNNRIN